MVKSLLLAVIATVALSTSAFAGDDVFGDLNAGEIGSVESVVQDLDLDSIDVAALEEATKDDSEQAQDACYGWGGWGGWYGGYHWYRPVVTYYRVFHYYPTFHHWCW